MDFRLLLKRPEIENSNLFDVHGFWLLAWLVVLFVLFVCCLLAKMLLVGKHNNTCEAETIVLVPRKVLGTIVKSMPSVLFVSFVRQDTDYFLLLVACCSLVPPVNDEK